MNVCIITSMLSFPDKPLSYSKVRSVFTTGERFKQTQETIWSARAWIPGCKVVLVEMSADKVQCELLRPYCDKAIFVGDRRLVRWACNSRNKGFGEAVGLLAALSEIPCADYYFKLSGRYCLNTVFKMEEWQRPGFTVRLYGQHYRSMSTRLYGFSADVFKKWRSALRWSLPGLVLGLGLECELWNELYGATINELPSLGVSGRVATDGTVLSE